MDDLILLFDVDNTLLDNDSVTVDLAQHLTRNFGRESAARYWEIFEALRAELGYTDYLGALQRYRLDKMDDVSMLQMSDFLLEYPFSRRLFTGAFDALARAHQWGTTVILSDGDVVFQPRKIRRSGLWDAVQGRVLVYIHKEKMLDAVMTRHPGRHYVMVEDKLRILAAMKAFLGERLTTIFVRQGHYAHDPANISSYPAADITLDRISDLVHLDLPERLNAIWAQARRNTP
ncbi:HAD family hydrolase [Candidimonas sp. SYP-B2681]|uniref:HAD family hydrolase n=1 Tax=Candidimonas sp. SYP-B2681 TaxID=2497686 RepID=UPI000F87CB52|nr:HAD family hydrolase [Candidimonas sp. SYP-B2681]RTZ44609.1 HAD family hydrolase [Candidimonas sp. SYP-B2681]